MSRLSRGGGAPLPGLRLHCYIRYLFAVLLSCFQLTCCSSSEFPIGQTSASLLQRFENRPHLDGQNLGKARLLCLSRSHSLSLYLLSNCLFKRGGSLVHSASSTVIFNSDHLSVTEARIFSQCLSNSCKKLLQHWLLWQQWQMLFLRKCCEFFERSYSTLPWSLTYLP